VPIKPGDAGINEYSLAAPEGAASRGIPSLIKIKMEDIGHGYPRWL